MTYGVILTFLCMILGAVAIIALFKRKMPNGETLKVAWEQSPTFPTPPSVHVTEMPMMFKGPDRYCPSCGRLLVKIHGDGTFDISGMTGLSATGECRPGQVLEALVVDAVCLICNPEE